jgi:hypothetical protein
MLEFVSTLWNEWSAFIAGPPASAYIPTPGNDDFANALQDLRNVQSDVQQYAPSLSNQWGYLVSQGALLQAGKPAQISVTAWWSNFRQFLLGLHGLECQEPQSVAPGNSCCGNISCASGGIYWTGLMILGGAVALAVVIKKVGK